MVMTFVIEAVLLAISFFVALVLGWVVELFLAIPIGFDKRILVVWVLTNLYLAWGEIKNGKESQSLVTSPYHELP